MEHSRIAGKTTNKTILLAIPFIIIIAFGIFSAPLHEAGHIFIITAYGEQNKIKETRFFRLEDLMKGNLATVITINLSQACEKANRTYDTIWNITYVISSFALICLYCSQATFKVAFEKVKT